MDPDQFYRRRKPRNSSSNVTDSTSADPSSSSAPPIITRSPFNSVRPSDGCMYWNTHRVNCTNGSCRELSERFRQCTGRPRERAIVDESSGTEKWVEDPMGEDDSSSMIGSGLDLFSNRGSVTDPMFPFASFGRATDDLFNEVLPEFGRIRRSMERDPFFNLVWGDWMGHRHGASSTGMSVGSSGAGRRSQRWKDENGEEIVGWVDETGDTAGKNNRRTIPITDARHETKKDDDDDDGRVGARDFSDPINRITSSLTKWTDKIKNIGKGSGSGSGSTNQNQKQNQNHDRYPAQPGDLDDEDF